MMRTVFFFLSSSFLKKWEFFGEKLQGVSCDTFKRQMKKRVGIKEEPLRPQKLR